MTFLLCMKGTMRAISSGPLNMRRGGKPGMKAVSSSKLEVFMTDMDEDDNIATEAQALADNLLVSFPFCSASGFRRTGLS
jgi:hypothetical protein